MSWLLELGYPLWLAFALEDAGVPPPFTAPSGDIGRVALTVTWRW